MIRLGYTLKVAENAHFLIREIPSSTLRVFTTQATLLEHPTNDQDELVNQSLPKSSLEYIFLALLAFVIICVILRRFRIYRSRQQQAAFQSSALRRYRNFPRPVVLQPLHPDRQSYPAYPDPFLRVIPAAYIHPPSRRTRARDIDSGGRRQDIPTEMDHDGDLGANDALPAYDNFGGPPKYFELDMLGRNRPPPLSGITRRPDVSWENINNSPENVGAHTPVGTTHPAHVSLSRPTPPYLENSSSNNAVPMTPPRHEIYRD